MVARSRNGSTKAFPVVETIHKDNICHTTEAPAQVTAEITLRAQQVAEQAVACLEGTAQHHKSRTLLTLPAFELHVVGGGTCCQQWHTYVVT